MKYKRKKVYDVNEIKIEGITPTKEYLELFEKEKRGEISKEEVARILNSYRVKE